MGKYICETPKEFLNVGFCTFDRDYYIDEDGEHDGYYAQFAIIDERDGEPLTDWVDDFVIHGEDLVGATDRYATAHQMATDYMLSVKDELIERYYKGEMTY